MMPVPTDVLACVVLEAEVAHVARRMVRLKHLEKLEQGRHDEPQRVCEQLQQTVDRMEKLLGIEATVLACGLCSRDTEGILCPPRSRP